MTFSIDGAKGQHRIDGPDVDSMPESESARIAAMIATSMKTGYTVKVTDIALGGILIEWRKQ